MVARTPRGVQTEHWHRGRSGARARLAASGHKWVYTERARRELLATSDTVPTRSVETRDELLRGRPPGIDAICITMGAARQAFPG